MNEKKLEKIINELRKKCKVSVITFDGVKFIEIEQGNYHYVVNAEEFVKKVEL